MKTADLLA